MHLKLFISVFSLFFIHITLAIATHQPIIVWKATFHDVIPNKIGITKTYCQIHSPGVFLTTANNILHNGAKDKNGVLVKYKYYI